MGMFNFVLDSFKGEIFDFKVKRRVFVASTVELDIMVSKLVEDNKVVKPNALMLEYTISVWNF